MLNTSEHMAEMCSRTQHTANLLVCNSRPLRIWLVGLKHVETLARREGGGVQPLSAVSTNSE